MSVSPNDRNSKKGVHRFKKLCSNDAGAILAPLAMLMPVLFGIVGLGIDLGSWYNAKRQVQAAADAAARAGALELVRENASSIAKQAAVEDAAAFGFVQDDIQVSLPPQSGGYRGDESAVEVVIRHEPQSFFSKHVLKSEVMVEGRAVGKAVASDICVWALEKEEPGFEIVGTADVQLDCGIQVNSKHETAFGQVGSSCVIATSINVVGGVSGDCVTPLPMTGVAAAADPLKDLDPPDQAQSGCTHANEVKIVNSTTLSPGVYCGGIRISGNADVTFEPGLYVLKSGTFKAAGQASLAGSGITFFLTDDANLDITAAAIDFSAPESGEMKDILFFQDRLDTSTIINKVAGNAGLELEGILYFPTTELHLRGTSSASAPAPVIIARVIRFVGTASFSGDGSPPPITVVEAELVE